MGHFNEIGFLFLTDRAKDIIIRGGENIGCAEVEAALAEHHKVFEVAVFGVPDERLGEVPAAVVMVSPGENVSADELKAYVADRLAKFKIPEHIWIQEQQLARIATGKIAKRQIRHEMIEKMSQ